MLNPAQLEILEDVSYLRQLSQGRFCEIAENKQPSLLNDEELLEFLQQCNAFYRAGQALLTDHDYDAVFLAELQRRNSEHWFLQNVEPEPIAFGKTVALPEKMLSTDKTYQRDGIERWLARIKKAAEEINVDFDSLVFRVTPKLDGYAAYDDGNTLFTRGDGRKGTDISRVFERGLVVGGGGARGLGAGEIVISQTYFKQHLAEDFENARNFQASIIKEKELELPALAAIKQQAAVFFPFAQLPAWTGTADAIIHNFESIIAEVAAYVDYDVDGVVFETTETAIKQYMGATRHHHRWQIAYKSNVDSCAVKVLQVTPQTSRSGRVNPVAELEPTKLSGAVISRATAHHYGMVKQLGIGIGTIIELTRSGLVIPKIERVIVPQVPQVPSVCPSCGSDLVWDSDYLYCLNTVQCPAQIENSIEHFFKTIANIDGFGEKTIEKLHGQGIRSVYEVYQLDKNTLMGMGFGEKTSENLLTQLERSQQDPIEDWRFLSAFGIHRMGLGNCERLLQHYRLQAIFDLTVSEIIEIEGFAEKTSAAVVESLRKIHPEFMQIYPLGFNLIPTPLVAEQPALESPIAGKTLVFTGTMLHGKREDMKKQAKGLGAKVAESVTGKTDWLIAGAEVGEKKMAAAIAKGVQVLSEDDYLALLRKL
ncbi:MAG: helix-hairpin-helix domain-containing protein [Methylococcaceae bacterium]|jgi:DNA ligase (NAD+)